MPERIDELANAWSPDDPEILDVLRAAEFERVRLVYSSNYVLIADLVHPERGTGLAVYKPQRGERPLSDFPFGSLHDREVAAYELSRLLGWEMIPPTVERDGPEGPARSSSSSGTTPTSTTSSCSSARTCTSSSSASPSST